MRNFEAAVEAIKKMDFNRLAELAIRGDIFDADYVRAATITALGEQHGPTRFTLRTAAHLYIHDQAAAEPYTERAQRGIRTANLVLEALGEF